MNKQETIAILREFNRWRRGEDDAQPMIDPHIAGLAIDNACSLLEADIKESNKTNESKKANK